MKLTTAGESHGKGLFAILEGVPAGLQLDLNKIDAELARRQSGYGRGERQKLEQDRAEILSGVRDRVTLGSPIAIAVWNKDYENWKPYMAPEGCDTSQRQLTKVRPGHADLAGAQKFAAKDARNVLERASARETAARVAAGEICRALLKELNVTVTGYVRSIGRILDGVQYSFEEIPKKRRPLLGMMNEELEREAISLIEKTKEAGETLGGLIELRVKGLKSGFGSCMTYAEKLDARIVSALMSVQAVKGVEVGGGFALASEKGSNSHDEIFAENGTYVRRTNRAGGIEGGMSNGEELVFRAAMKPIPTLMKGLSTVDIGSGGPAVASPERSDVCAVTACEVVLESALNFVLAEAVSERLGGDTMAQLIERYEKL